MRHTQKKNVKTRIETKFNETFLLAFDILCALLRLHNNIVCYEQMRTKMATQRTYVDTQQKRKYLSEKGKRRLAKKRNCYLSLSGDISRF